MSSVTDPMLYKISHTLFSKTCFYSGIYMEMIQFFRSKKDAFEEFLLKYFLCSKRNIYHSSVSVKLNW